MTDEIIELVEDFTTPKIYLPYNDPDESQLGVLKFIITPDHIDYAQIKSESYSARAFKNSLTAVTRNKYFAYRDKANADLSISAELNVDVLAKRWHKKKQCLVPAFTYNKNVLARADIYGNIRKKVTPELHSKIAQALAREVADAWSSYWALSKDPTQNPSIPGYNKKSVYGTVPYNSGMFSKRALNNNKICMTTWVEGFELPNNVKPEQIKSAIIKPISCNKFILLVLHEVDKVTLTNSLKYYTDNEYGLDGLTAVIDYGGVNLVTLAFSDFREGLLFDGLEMRKMLDHYNKITSKLISLHDKERGCIARKQGISIDKVPKVKSKRLDALRWKCKVRLHNYVTQVNNRIIKELCDAGVTTLVIGWNKNFKQNINMGKTNNRHFMGVPHAYMRDDIIRKANQVGIRVIVTEESYTSRASFMLNDPLPVKDPDKKVKHKFSGRRTKRGLYINSDGSTIHADLNGAYNILRKVFPLFQRREGCFTGFVVRRVRDLTPT